MTYHASVMTNSKDSTLLKNIFLKEFGSYIKR